MGEWFLSFPCMSHLIVQIALKFFIDEFEKFFKNKKFFLKLGFHFN